MSDKLPTLRFRDWLAFWKENMSQSYKAASDHNNLASFIGSIVTAILGVAGVSTLTDNKTLAALGAGLGLLAWFFFLALFITPAKMWTARNDLGALQSAADLREKSRLLCAQISKFLELRDHTRPSYVLYDAANHDRETRELYLQRFAPQIQAILKELAESGLTDAALDKAYLLDSDQPLDVRSIAARIKVLADQLPLVAPSVAALHEANTNLRNKLDALEGAHHHRRLTEKQRSVIRRVMEDCFAEISKDMPEEEIKTYRPMEISIVALGSERETTTYRNDLVEAFSVNGFVGRPTDWSAGMREHDVFNDLVTVLLPRDPRNIIHPKVLKALQDASLNPKEAPYPPMPQMHRSWAESSPVVTVIVGPR